MDLRVEPANPSKARSKSCGNYNRPVPCPGGVPRGSRSPGWSVSAPATGPADLPATGPPGPARRAERLRHHRLHPVVDRRPPSAQQEDHADAHAAGVDQPHDPAVTEVHAALHVVKAEMNIRGGDPDVAGECQPMSPPITHPLSAAMIGLLVRCSPPVIAPAKPRPSTLRPRPGPPSNQPTVNMGGQVGAGAERLVTSTGQDSQPHVRVVAEVGP